MGDSEHEVRFAPGAVQHWLEIGDPEARPEAFEIIEQLRQSGTAPRTFSLLNGPAHRAYGSLVKVLFHRDAERKLVSIVDVVLR